MNHCKILAAANIHPNIAKGFSKHERRYDAGNLLTKAGESTNDSLHTEELLSSTISGPNSDDFGDGRIFFFLVVRNTYCFGIFFYK